MHAKKWKLVGVADNSQRGSSDRVREKMERIKHFAREAVKDKVCQPVSSDDREEVQSLRLALQTLRREAEVNLATPS